MLKHGPLTRPHLHVLSRPALLDRKLPERRNQLGVALYKLPVVLAERQEALHLLTSPGATWHRIVLDLLRRPRRLPHLAVSVHHSHRLQLRHGVMRLWKLQRDAPLFRRLQELLQQVQMGVFCFLPRFARLVPSPADKVVHESEEPVRWHILEPRRHCCIPLARRHVDAQRHAVEHSHAKRSPHTREMLVVLVQRPLIVTCHSIINVHEDGVTQPVAELLHIWIPLRRWLDAAVRPPEVHCEPPLANTWVRLVRLLDNHRIGDPQALQFHLLRWLRPNAHRI